MKSNNRFTKVAVATGLIVCSGAAVLGLTGFASAQVANNPVAVVAATDDATTPDSGAPAAPAEESGTGTITAQAADGATIPAITEDHADRPNPLAVAAKAIGVTEAELRTELQAGKSIADVAKAKNVDLADVKKALLDEMKTHLAEEVASGKHTQAEADAKLAEATTRIDTMVTTAGLPMGRGGHGAKGMGGHRGPGKFATADLAKVLKLTEAELQTQLQSGKSLADIAKAQSVDVADVKAQLTADFTAHLDEEVKAGEHTQAEADAKLAEFKTRLDDMVNGVRPAGGMKGDKMGGMMGGHGGRGGHSHGDGPMGAPGGATTEGTSTPTGAAFSA